MPKAKGGKNPFFFFLLDYRDKHNCSMQAAAEGAGRIWERMDQNARKPYLEKCSVIKQAGKLTSLHENIDEVEKEKKIKDECEMMMRNDIETTIQRYMACNTINTEYFHILHINNFCYANSTKRHYPGELAIVRFNLTEGVIPENVYHERIEPGRLPLGYAHSARINALESHKLPVPNDDSENNMDLVFQKLCFFLQESSYSKEMPAIYVSAKHDLMIKEILHQMCDDFGFDKADLRIYSLEYLLFVLKNALHDHVVWPTVNQSFIEIERDVFSFTDKISCNYHEETDVAVHCSRSIVVRLAYVVCDHCCTAANITLIPGQHVPQHSRLNILPEVLDTIELEKDDDQRSTTNTNATTYREDRSISAYEAQSYREDNNGWTTQRQGRRVPSVSGSSVYSRVSVPREQSDTNERVRNNTNEREQPKAAPKRISRRPFTMSASLAGSSHDTVVSNVVFSRDSDSE